MNRIARQGNNSHHAEYYEVPSTKKSCTVVEAPVLFTRTRLYAHQIDTRLGYMKMRSPSLGSIGDAAASTSGGTRNGRNGGSSSMKRARPSASSAATGTASAQKMIHVTQRRRKFVLASPSLISVALAALFSLLSTSTTTVASSASTAATSRAHNQQLPRKRTSTRLTDVVDILHDGGSTSTTTTEESVAMMVPESNDRVDGRRNLGDIDTISITRQGRAFDVSLSPLSRHLDFGAITQLNDVLGDMVIANLDLTSDTEIEFSAVLLTQDIRTANPGNVPVLTVRVLKTAYITLPSSEENKIPTDDSFDEAVQSLFEDVQQKQELVYRLRETNNAAFSSLLETELAGFMTDEPTSYPTNQPSHRPSRPHTATPSSSPTMKPTMKPTEGPTKLPSSSPSSIPTLRPTPLPSATPTVRPSHRPSTVPSSSPSHSPTSSPTFGFADLTVEGNVFDISLTPMAAPLDFWSAAYFNDALSDMVRRNLVLDFKAKVKFTTALLYQSIQSGPDDTKKQGEQSQEQPLPRWQYDNTRRLEANRVLTHEAQALTSSTTSGVDLASSVTTLIARVRLTAHVSVPTNGGGKYNAHFIPNMDDMDNAVSAIFADPVQQRELLERLRDSYHKFKPLTDVDFVGFIYPPTPLPSAMPSVSPSDFPTVARSESPSMLPSIEPSSSASESPSDLPTLAPSFVPSTAPSLYPAVVSVRGNIIEITLSPVTQLLDFGSIDTVDAVLDDLVGYNLAAIAPDVDKDSVSFSTNLISQHIDNGNTLKVRVSRVAHFSVPAKAPGIPADSAAVPTGAGIDLATQIVFTDVYQRASLIEKLRMSARDEKAGSGDSNADASTIGGSNEVFQKLREVDFQQFVYPPTPEPTREPSVRPSARPTVTVSSAPSSSPTPLPSSSPSSKPSGSPSDVPTLLPSASPSSTPSVPPTKAPTATPTTAAPSASAAPSRMPSTSPTDKPTYLPVTLDIPLSDFTLLFSPMDSYLAQGARDELNTVLDQMIIENLILSKDLDQAKIEISTTVLSQLTSEDEGEGLNKKGGKRRRLQQRQPDPYLAIAFRKVAHITIQTLDIFGNINEEALPDSASFDLAVLTIFTDLSEKERFVLSLIDSIARFSNLRNVVVKDSVSSRWMPPPVVSSGGGDDISSSASDQIIPGVSNSMFYGIVATASVIICAVGLAAGKLILSKRASERNGNAAGGFGGRKRERKIGSRSKDGSGRPLSATSGNRSTERNSRPGSHPGRRSSERPNPHRHHHHRHHGQRPVASQEYNHHLQQMPQQYHHPQEPGMQSWGAHGMATGQGMAMEDESDSVSELEVGESVVANMMSMKEQEGAGGGHGTSRPPDHSFGGGPSHHHHAPRRSAHGHADQGVADGGDYGAWDINQVSTWDRVDAT